MSLLTIILTVTANEDELFCAKATEALAELTTTQPFMEGTYDDGHVFVAKNGVRMQANYRMEERPS